jgi:hypothetical protein
VRWLLVALAAKPSGLPESLASQPIMINSSPQARRTNPLAIAALICGIVQFAKVPFLDIIAVILGHRALRQIRQTGDDGYGMAKVGLILGYIGIALDVVAICVIVFLVARSHGSSCLHHGPQGNIEVHC